jgi:hypothetical protein
MQRLIWMVTVVAFCLIGPSEVLAQKNKPKAKTDPTLTMSKKQKKVKKKIVKKKKRAAMDKTRPMNWATNSIKREEYHSFDYDYKKQNATA